MTVRLFRDTGAGGAGGLGLTLTELGDGDGGLGSFSTPGFQPNPPAGGEPNPPVPDANGKLPGQEGYVAPAANPNPPPPPPPDPKKDANGKLPGEEGYIDPDKPADEPKVDKNGKKPGEEGYIDPDVTDDNAEFDPANFFGEVDKITGKEVKVEYPQDMDPLSAEGIAIRENTIREHAMDEYDSFLAQRDRRGYAYLLHRQAGGKDEDFFNKDNPGFVLPTADELAASADIQKQVYTADLKGKGLDDETVTALVEKAIKDNKLKEKATTAFTAMDTAEKTLLKKNQDAELERQAEREKSIKGAVTAVENVVKNHMRFILPPEAQSAFHQFVLNNMQYDGQSFTIATQVDDNNLVQVMESLFFLYNKGDLSKYVQREIKTKAAQSLRGRLKGAEKRSADSSGAGDNKPAFVALGDI